MKKIVLASASPRRKELLEQIGLKFEVAPSDYPENLDVRIEPEELVRKIALEKARAVAGRYRNAVIIAADTVGVFQGKIVGKPSMETEAKEMLQALSGNSHDVITGLAVVDTESGRTVTRTVTTRVYFRKLTREEIDAYVKTKEPLDKAGAYAIQGLGAVIVEKIEGDYYNVVGLPLSALAEILREFGVRVL